MMKKKIKTPCGATSVVSVTDGTKLAALLKKLGAEVSYSDPYVPALKLDGVDLKSQDAQASAGQADCAVIITDHSDFDYKGLLDSSRLIVDTRNAMRGFESEKIVRL